MKLFLVLALIYITSFSFLFIPQVYAFDNVGNNIDSLPTPDMTIKNFLRFGIAKRNPNFNQLGKITFSPEVSMGYGRVFSRHNDIDIFTTVNINYTKIQSFTQNQNLSTGFNSQDLSGERIGTKFSLGMAEQNAWCTKKQCLGWVVEVYTRFDHVRLKAVHPFNGNRLKREDLLNSFGIEGGFYFTLGKLGLFSITVGYDTDNQFQF